MNAAMGVLLLDGGTASGFEWIPLASGTLVLILGGLGVAIVQRRWGKEDDEEKREKTGIKSQLAEFGLQLATEREERHRDLTEEASQRREKDESLGMDISKIREEIAFQAGQHGKERPKFGHSTSSGG